MKQSWLTFPNSLEAVLVLLWKWTRNIFCIWQQIIIHYESFSFITGLVSSTHAVWVCFEDFCQTDDLNNDVHSMLKGRCFAHASINSKIKKIIIKFDNLNDKNFFLVRFIVLFVVCKFQMFPRRCLFERGICFKSLHQLVSSVKVNCGW